MTRAALSAITAGSTPVLPLSVQDTVCGDQTETPVAIAGSN